jgi:hypothetical protein
LHGLDGFIIQLLHCIVQLVVEQFWCGHWRKKVIRNQAEQPQM